MTWTVFVRTCQECDYELVCKPPTGEPTPAYWNRKCPRCKSEAFDYGSEVTKGGPLPDDDE